MKPEMPIPIEPGPEDELDIEYNPTNETLEINYDIDNDNVPDITLKIRIGIFLRKYAPAIVVTVSLLGLGILHTMGYL